MCVVACTVCQHIRILDVLVPTPTISHGTKADRVLGAPIRPTGRVRVFWHFSCHLTSPHSSYPRGYHGPFGARAAPVRYRGLRSGFEPSGLDRPGRLPHQQGLCEAARLGLQDGSPQLPKSCWFLLLSKIQNLFSSFRVSVPAVRWEQQRVHHAGPSSLRSTRVRDAGGRPGIARGGSLLPLARTARLAPCWEELPEHDSHDSHDSPLLARRLRPHALPLPSSWAG